MDIQILNTKDELSLSFTEWLKTMLEEKEELTIALSGGSTPKQLFNYWSQLPEGEINWEKVILFWGDERCVPPTDEESNYKMTKEHLLNHVPIPQRNIFRIEGENDPEQEAVRYSHLLQEKLVVQGGLPIFDLVMLGMGDDGHTASIFPHQMELWDSNENCVVAIHPTTGQRRVSITGKVINAARNVAFLVTGANKADKVKEIISQPDEAAKKYPAARVEPDTGNLYWFLDQQAANKLTGY